MAASSSPRLPLPRALTAMDEEVGPGWSAFLEPTERHWAQGGTYGDFQHPPSVMAHRISAPGPLGQAQGQVLPDALRQRDGELALLVSHQGLA